nr:STAS domain-containing protein [uncultured Duganella sp.]
MTSPTLVIATLLQRHGAELHAQWMDELQPAEPAPGAPGAAEVRALADTIVAALAAHFAAGPGAAAIADDSVLATAARQLSALLARNGGNARHAGFYFVALKNVLLRRLAQDGAGAPAPLVDCLRAASGVLDRLSLLSFEAFVAARERVIAQQSLSLLELSTPVILLWNRVLLLPLVGVIDTVRARHFTERLLACIAKHEAAVTIVDVTGVPVFDTGVARHIMKAVDAASLLGSRIVMTGISPEGAQTLTKLGISFDNVISRATLRSGVAEALKLVGRRVEPIGGGRA